MAGIGIHELMVESGVAFGTSGARGEVVAMTDRVCYGYTQGFLTYLAEQGEFSAGCNVAIAGDLRPSTPRILAACARAIRDLGGVPVFCGYVPTPALALFSFAEGIPSLMVTGSHIPADRNGIKFYRSTGEVLKVDEAGIGRQIVAFPADAFTEAGALTQSEVLPPVTDVETAYARRYIDHFGESALNGLRIGVYQHTAVGRDLLSTVLSALGAEVTLLGRSEVFVPVDTEAIRPQDIELARKWSESGEFDAIVSTDGDSDRPLISDEFGSWLRGDVLGILCAARIGATSVVTPISSNSALELSGKFPRCRRTRIGSPYVIAAMTEEQLAGSPIVCGYEANGGFLLGTDIAGANGSITKALPTRDAFLPILLVLTNRDLTISRQLAELPQRYTFSNRIAPFPPSLSKRLFDLLKAGERGDQLALQTRLFGHFAGGARSIDLTDGVRTTFVSGLVVHLRGSGNAPELRCYTEGGSEIIAEEANRLALHEVQSMIGGT